VVRHASIPSVLLGMLLPASWASAEMTLVQNGRSACSIVVAADAGEHEKTAAADLQLYLSRMSGARVPIGADASVPGNRVLVGVFDKPPVKEWKGDRPTQDGFAIETVARQGGGTDLFLVGGDPRGAGYAVYELLERFLGVRWYMPCELGEEAPARKTIVLEALKWRNQPDYQAVGGLIWAGGPGAKDWLRRNKGEVGSPTFFFGHAWSGYIDPSEENKKAHPEWFALNKDGTRSYQLCTTNPEVISIFIDKVHEYFDKNPDAVLASISPNDGGDFCTCERCRAIDAQYGVTDDSQTDRFIHFANAILKEVKKKHPDKLVGILAYVSHTRPPVSAVPDPNYATMICHTPWEFCHVHSIEDPGCKANTRFREMIEGWTKVCRHVSVYDYYGHFYVMTPWPIVHGIRKDLPYLRGLGVTGFMSETQQHWANQGLNFYIAAKLVWDAGRDSRTLLDDFYRGFYGPAETPMRQYWEAWEAAMVRQPCGGYAWLAMFTPDLMEQTGRLLDEAERLAGDSEKVHRRLALHRIGHRFTDAYARMLRHGNAGELEQAVAAGEEAVRIAEASQGTEPQAFWIRLTSDQTGIQMMPFVKKLKASKPADGRAPGEVSVNPKDGAEMVYVPAGEFPMGSREAEGSAHERPRHTVYLDAYWIYKTPVTVAQYRKFCEATGRNVPAPHHNSKDDHPVVSVSWEDADAYARWVGAALPTEAQWEKAARGPDGRIYPWGDYLDSVKRRDATLNDEEQTRPVGRHPEVSSPYGVQDMTGNVWQWCADWYDADYYRNSPARNPAGPPTGTARVLRGGRWFINHPNFFPATYRNSCSPQHWLGFCGFRCAMNASAQ
jgi:formylglycine-generating enzyme